MKNKFKYIFNKTIDLIRIVVAGTIGGLLAVLFGEFCGWLFKFFYEILTK